MRNVFDKPGIDPVLTFSLPAPYLLLLSTLAIERKKNGQNRGEICKGTGPRTKKHREENIFQNNLLYLLHEQPLIQKGDRL